MHFENIFKARYGGLSTFVYYRNTERTVKK